MMKIIDGKKMAEEIRAEVKLKVSSMDKTPGLAIILVGDDPASHTYVGLKQKACEETGIYFEKFLYESDTPEQTLIEKISELNSRGDINGILVQLPLPTQNEDEVIAAIDPRKDVDGFHLTNQKLLEENKPCLAPATALGIMRLIHSTREKLEGKTTAVIGSEFFARPLRKLLSDEGVTTDRLDPNEITENDTKKYDVLISVVGRPGLITPQMIKDGATVIDVGTTRVGDKMLGDVAIEAQNEKTGWLTPVPGGVGPMTVAMLLMNVLKASSSW